jgi:hypothetical protein
MLSLWRKQKTFSQQTMVTLSEVTFEGNSAERSAVAFGVEGWQSGAIAVYITLHKF